VCAFAVVPRIDFLHGLQYGQVLLQAQRFTRAMEARSRSIDHFEKAGDYFNAVLMRCNMAHDLHCLAHSHSSLVPCQGFFFFAAFLGHYFCMATKLIDQSISPERGQWIPQVHDRRTLH
jgi:hypothetical protein